MALTLVLPRPPVPPRIQTKGKAFPSPLFPLPLPVGHEAAPRVFLAAGCPLPGGLRGAGPRARASRPEAPAPGLQRTGPGRTRAAAGEGAERAGGRAGGAGAARGGSPRQAPAQQASSSSSSARSGGAVAPSPGGVPGRRFAAGGISAPADGRTDGSGTATCAAPRGVGVLASPLRPWSAARGARPLNGPPRSPPTFKSRGHVG